MQLVKGGTTGPAIAFGGFLLVIVIFFIIRHGNSVDELVETEFSGRVIYIHWSKSHVEVVLDNKYESYTLHGFSEYKNVLRIGDSLSKEANSNIINYYRRSGDKYIFHDAVALQD